MMKVLVVGSGGREHALVWKLAQSRMVDKIFCAPGNGGIADIAECLAIKSEDIASLLDFARKEKIELTIVGPEAPLAEGIVDEFQKHHLAIFGPNKKAALLEASKVFAKQLMAKYSIPTAKFEIFEDPDEAERYVLGRDFPCVIKADGLAQGKGVMVVKDVQEASNAINVIMRQKIFGSAGRRILIEDYLEGEEASILVITDSQEVIPLPSSQDHKRVFDGDRGPNTGGMGAYSPAPVVSSQVYQEVLDRIVYKTVDALVKEGIEYRGVLYAGIMITKDGPKVLEFNVRFGDPETQVILPRLDSDLLEVMLATSHARLSRIKNSGGLKWSKRSCVCVVCASCGYPQEYQKGKVILGLDVLKKYTDVIIFHAGTKRVDNQGKFDYLTDGGRVLGVTALGDSIREAIFKAYEAVGHIQFEGMHYRRDIGSKALEYMA